MEGLIKDFKTKCIEWQRPYDIDEVHFVYNKDLDNLVKEDIKYILVADNPGNIEAQHERYLIGPAGLAARVYFERAMVSDFKKEVIVLNKTPIYTSITDKLENLKEQSQESQEYMVNLIVELSLLLNAPIIISGYSNGLIKRKDKLAFNNKSLRPFFMKFADKVREKKITDYYIISHFSRNMFYHASANDIVSYEENPSSLLLNQGVKNREMFEKACL